ncbi:MAG: hypothetical protein KDD61_06125 [Bdellovibrionales bacterium]|nr:hypothetical protein [Bdellovibrionales bacterium]
MKYVLTFCIILFSFPVFANLPINSSEVEVVNIEDQADYQNIPKVSKEFRGAKNTAERKENEIKCQEWVFRTMTEHQTPLYKVWCALKKDVVLREYIYTGNILIKNWSP